jgi:uncharacterized Zn finger protein
MAEIIKENKICYICDKCGEGEMEAIALLDTLAPARYLSVCNKCGFVHDMLRKYPKIIEITK